MSDKEHRMRKGDDVVVVLRGAGVETREESQVVSVRKGIIYTTDSDYGYDLLTLQWLGPDFGGFSRRIEASA